MALSAKPTQPPDRSSSSHPISAAGKNVVMHVGKLYNVLAHELAHVQRFDWPLQLEAEGVCAALWFNPIAWVVARRLRDEGERACDDVVLALGDPAA